MRTFSYLNFNTIYIKNSYFYKAIFYVTNVTYLYKEYCDISFVNW